MLQKDTDSKYTSGKVQKQKNKNDIKRISWLSQSPNLNPMENVQVILKVNISNYKLISTKDFIKINKKEQRKLDRIFAENLVLSIKNIVYFKIIQLSENYF